jgi:GR25 family glycosyltransferase involved in LPS biosynthesis
MFGEIGIWASNYFAWKNFLETDADCLILVEDDLVISPRLLEVLPIYMEELPEGWDMLTAYVPTGQYIKYNETHDVGAKTICKTYQDWSLAFYVINRQSAEKLLQSVSEGVVYPPDWHFYKQPEKFNVYAPKPQDAGFCSLSGADSTYQFRDTRAPLEGNI